MQDPQLSKSPSQGKTTLPTPPSSLPCDSEKCQILAKKGFLNAKRITTGLVLLVYSQGFQLGVLLHLPSLNSSNTAGIDSQEQAFAKAAIAMILAEFETLGVSRNELVTYAIGGSASEGTREVTKLAMKRALWSYGLPLSACDLGGKQIRSVWMDVESGRIIVRSEPMLKNAFPVGAPLPVAS
jgi:chemotaxis receptor (MCP) glutamine deamidase CheD